MKLPLLTLAAMLASTATASLAAPYSLLIYETAAQIAQRDSAGDSAAYWSAFDAYAGGMAKAGVLRGGTALKPLSGADTERQLSGYFVIEVADLKGAQAWAAKAPHGIVVQVAPHQLNPRMKAQ